VAGPSSSHVTSADMSRFLMLVMIVITVKWVPVTMAMSSGCGWRNGLQYGG